MHFVKCVTCLVVGYDVEQKGDDAGDDEQGIHYAPKQICESEALWKVCAA